MKDKSIEKEISPQAIPKTDAHGARVFMNLLSDEGFKRAFGLKEHPEFLIDFLNLALGGREVVTSISYLPQEMFGIDYEDKKIVFDLLCETQNQTQIIIEIQRYQHKNFLERIEYYPALNLVKNVDRGVEWRDVKFKKIYTIAILNFSIKPESPNFHHHVVRYDLNDKEEFGGIVETIYFEASKLVGMDVCKCSNNLEKWLWCISNLHLYAKAPKEIDRDLLKSFFNHVKISILSSSDLAKYEESMAIFDNDWENLKEYSEEQGVAKEKIEIVKNLIAKGCDWDFICDVTKVSEEEYSKLIAK